MSKPRDVIKITEEYIKKLESEGKKVDIAVENAGIKIILLNLYH